MGCGCGGGLVGLLLPLAFCFSTFVCSAWEEAMWATLYWVPNTLISPLYKRTVATNSDNWRPFYSLIGEEVGKPPMWKENKRAGGRGCRLGDQTWKLSCFPSCKHATMHEGLSEQWPSPVSDLHAHTQTHSPPMPHWEGEQHRHFPPFFGALSMFQCPFTPSPPSLYFCHAFCQFQMVLRALTR